MLGGYCCIRLGCTRGGQLVKTPWIERNDKGMQIKLLRYDSSKVYYTSQTRFLSQQINENPKCPFLKKSHVHLK